MGPESGTGTGAGTSTAHRHWDQQWQAEAGRARWSTPEPWVADTVPLLRERRVRRVLDVGCGIGRHAAFLAGQGFAVVGADRSVSGIAHARRLAMASPSPADRATHDATDHATDHATENTTHHAGDRITYLVAGFDRLPFADASFDYVLAWNVLYHGDEAVFATALAEVRRVLAPGGLYQATMLSKRNAQHGRGIEISRNTFVQPDADDDKKHPHLYCDADDLLRLHRGMELLTAFDAEQGEPGNNHWHVLFE